MGHMALLVGPFIFRRGDKYMIESQIPSQVFNMVDPGFQLSLGPSLDSEGEGLSRVWTQVHIQPFQRSVSDFCPILPLADIEFRY